ncbi:hypothetical protein H5410_051507 [Solanum commersonii]|uniref:Uncharacterized protein n=1 Tax=Solanum commersonii TaxID=4109 RepID=A0A9J5X168_SOLCO|nr:hypothetical protein H5410_051507 [Solanum commersonii]
MDMFVGVIPDRCGALLNSANNYLLSYTYVNFGVTLAIKNMIPAKPSKGRVNVIGAGLVGLVAARQVMLFGFELSSCEKPVDEHLDRNGLLDKASKLKQEVFSGLEVQIHIVITRIFQLGGSEFPYHKPVEGSISYLPEDRGVELKQLATT